MTGRLWPVIYARAADTWEEGPAGAIFHGLPLYDSPVLVAEKNALRFEPVR